MELNFYLHMSTFFFFTLFSFLNVTILCRFIDVNQGQKLHLWRSESVESNFPCMISSICSCGSDNMQAGGAAGSPSWIAAGLSSGICRLLDVRSGDIIASWQAHDGYVTKVHLSILLHKASQISTVLRLHCTSDFQFCHCNLPFFKDMLATRFEP